MFFYLFTEIWFWIGVVGGLAMIVSVACEKGIFAFLSIVATLLLVEFLGKQDVWGFFLTYWRDILIWALAYFPIGVAWSFIKWLVVLRSARMDYEEQRADFLKRARLPLAEGQTYQTAPMPSTLVEAWKVWVTDNMREYMGDEYRSKYPPKAGEHKACILRWIGYWPLSIVITLFGDFFEHIVKEIFNYLSQMYNRLADKIIGDRIRKDIEIK
jgi:hypothetical protein